MKKLINRNSPIGFFDSGVGGISVMKRAIELMPNENYIYYGDSKNAPYGVKSVNEVKELTHKAVDFLLDKGCKAIVIACNTATSAAVNSLRKTYKDIPIIGIEPALKPAVESGKAGKIIIMATNMTLSEVKFKNLMHKYEEEKEIIPLPMPGLVEFIENGVLEGQELTEFLKDKLKPYNNSKISTIVLGCTHYPFARDTISKIVSDNVDIIDGSLGTSKELRRRLEVTNLINQNTCDGYIHIYNSSENKKIINFCYELLDK